MIPFELITGGVSYLISFASKALAMKQKTAHEEKIATLQALTQKENTVQNARAFKEEGLHFTRRIIALTVIGAAFIGPFIVPLYGDFGLITYIQQSVAVPGFWPFIDPTTVLEMDGVRGYVQTPLLGHAAMSVLGFYFGQSNHK